MADSTTIEFATLGMFIIDQINFPNPGHSPSTPNVKVVDDIIGGAGTYGILGARLFSPPPLSKCMGWIVHAGNDFPESIINTLKSWDTTLILRRTPDRLTTRGWNFYGPSDHRAFKYLTPKLRLEVSDFLQTLLIDSLSFHLICNPSRCSSLIKELSRERRLMKAEQFLKDRTIAIPSIIWEPVPDLCTPETLAACLETLAEVDIVSPNAAEIGAFYGVLEPEASQKEVVEKHARLWAEKVKHAVVIRCGKDGCCVVEKDGIVAWLPAYYDSQAAGVDVNKVVDPTGGGNSFIGGLAVGIVRTGSLSLAACYATVAASFAIEQIGMPILSLKAGSSDELWNDVSVQERLNKYLIRVGVESQSVEVRS